MTTPWYERDPLAEIRKALTADPAAAGVFHQARVFKHFTCDEVKAEQADRRQIRFTITTSTKDRMKDTIAADGWRLDSYKKNPVVLYGHDYRGLPVARSIELERKGEGLSSVAEFATREQYPFADTVYQLLLGKFLNATSVGFDPLKWVFNEETHGIDFKEQDLLEYSVVPVPANPECLIAASAQGIDVEPMKEWAERVLDGCYGEPGLYLPRRQVEKMLAYLPDHNKTISIPAPTPPAKCPVCADILVDGACKKCLDAAAQATAQAEADARAVLILKIRGQVAALLGEGKLDEALEAAFGAPKAPESAPPAGGLKLELVDDEVVLHLVDEIVPEPEARLNVDAAIIREALRDLVTDTVKAALNRARGRVD